MYELNDGNVIPEQGLGTCPAQGRECIDMIVSGIQAGYRLIDTAQQYNNEASIGEGIRLSGIDRRELYLTTKIAGVNQGSKLTMRSIEDSLERFGTDYIDLVLVHWPNPRQGLMIQTWEALIKAKHNGLVVSIGVSNFLPEQILELTEATMVMPAVNQIQLDPFMQQVEQRQFHAKHQIVTQSWGPFGTRIQEELQRDPTLSWDGLTLERIAADANLSVPALTLAWLHQQRIVALPRSVNPQRQQENLAAASVELDPATMDAMAQLRPFHAHYKNPHTHEEW